MFNSMGIYVHRRQKNIIGRNYSNYFNFLPINSSLLTGRRPCKREVKSEKSLWLV